MKPKTKALFTIMSVLSWLAFIGLLIKAGSILISYSVSIKNPEAAKNLYLGLNYYSLRQFDFWHYTGVVMLMAALLVLESYIAFLIIRVLSKVKVANPFTIEVSMILQKIGYLIVLTWIVAMFYNGNVAWLSGRVAGLAEHLISTDFIFLAGVVFVFSQLFKRGVEIQSDNELTV